MPDNTKLPAGVSEAEQEAACARMMDGLEAQADIWAEEVRLVDIVKAMGYVSRGLTNRMPAHIKNGFIDRQEAQIDAIVRQAYLEGFYRGGESRKQHDAAALGDSVVVPREPTNAALDALAQECLATSGVNAGQRPPPRPLNSKWEWRERTKPFYRAVVAAAAQNNDGEA